MMYKLVKDAKNQVASIVETTTDQVIHSYSMQDPGYEQSAKIYLRSLNSGGGFDGWTPEFLLCRFAI
jgi:hypothetical protein